MKQELTHRRALVREHLLDEVVDEVPVGPGELGDETAGVLAPLDRECGELERGDPPLGAFLEGLDVPGCESESRDLGKVLGRLVEGEPQVGGTDLNQLPAHPPASQWQVRVGAAAQHDVDVGRQVREQEGQPPADLAVVHEVEVVEDPPHVTRCCCQLVEQSCQHEFGRHGGGDELQRSRANAGHGGLQRADDVRPEGRRLVVGGVERQPCHASVRALDLLEPAGQERGLAEPRRRGHKRQRGVGAAT